MSSGETHYATLGVSSDTSPEEIQAAYRDLARAFHPDRHHAAPTAVRGQAERLMASINEAHHVLSDPERRAAYDRQHAVSRNGHQMADGRWGPEETTRRFRPPGRNECDFCGHSPAIYVDLRHEIGMILFRRYMHLDARLCRDCGIAMNREMTSRTVLTGWWGLLSFFANFAALIENFSSWTKLRKLDRPTPPTDPILCPNPRPLPVGKPLLFRGRFLAFLLVVTAGVWALAGGSAQPAPPSSPDIPAVEPEDPTPDPRPEPAPPPPPSDGEDPSPGDLVGFCINIVDEMAEPTDCNRPHDYVIVEHQVFSDECPNPTAGYIPYEWQGIPWALCLDEAP